MCALFPTAEEFASDANPLLYRAMASAEYSGGAPGDEQLLHADYANYTMVVPRHEAGCHQLEAFVYLSDVTPDKAATRMVLCRLVTGLPVERTYLSPAGVRRRLRRGGPGVGICRLDPDLPPRRLPSRCAHHRAEVGGFDAAGLLQAGRYGLARLLRVARCRRAHTVAQLRELVLEVRERTI